MGNQAKGIVPYDADGRTVGVFGVLEILAENTAWIRSQVKDLVENWSPKLVEGTAEALHRCLKEVPKQVSNNDLQRIANSYPRAVQHAGVHAPSFIELVCQSLGARFCFICERRASRRDIEQILDALAKANFDELAAEVSRELRIPSDSVLAESVVKPTQIVTAKLYSYMVPEDHHRASNDLATFHRDVGAALHIVRTIQNCIAAGIIPSDSDIKCAIGYGRLLDVDRKVILKFAALHDKQVSFAGRSFDAFHHAATIVVGEEFQRLELFGQGCGGSLQYRSFAELVPNAKKQYQACIAVGKPMLRFEFDVEALWTRCEIEFEQLTESFQGNLPPATNTSVSLKVNRLAECQMLVTPKDWSANRPTDACDVVRDTIGLAWTLHNLQAALLESPQRQTTDRRTISDHRFVGAKFALFSQRRWWLDEIISSRASELRIRLRKLHEVHIHWNGQLRPSFSEAAWDSARDIFTTIFGLVINLPGGQSCNWHQPFAAGDFDLQGNCIQAAYLSGALTWPTDCIDFRSLAAGIEVEWAKLMPTDFSKTPSPTASDGLKTKTQRSQEAAYQSYELAAENLDGPTDQDAYEWLKENGPAEYKLPTFETWKRYVRSGRRVHGTQKNSPRHGRSGRSVTRIESLDDPSTRDDS